MTFRLTWLYDVLLKAQGGGLVVLQVPGWQTRGHGDVKDTLGVLCHHTAGPLHGDAPSLPVVVNGRPDLAGPLAQLFLARSGAWHIVAAGNAWHAGKGWPGTKWEHFDGNGHFVGIEAENTGLPNDPWPPVQLESYARGCAAILTHLGLEASSCLGHKEYAGPRKSDPDFDMDGFRARVAERMAEG